MRVPDVQKSIKALEQDQAQEQAMQVFGYLWRGLKSDWRRLPSALSPWLAVPLFFLPWVNLSCNETRVFHQTGYETCSGAYTPEPMFEQKQSGGQPLPTAGNVLANPGNPDPNQTKKDDDLASSVLTWAYAIALAAACICGLIGTLFVVLRMSRVAAPVHLVTLLLASSAFLLLLLQVGLGFPLDRKVSKAMADLKEHQNKGPTVNHNDPFGQNSQFADRVKLQTSYSFALWLSLVVTVISLPFLILESTIAVYALARWFTPPLNAIIVEDTV